MILKAQIIQSNVFSKDTVRREENIYLKSETCLQILENPSCQRCRPILEHNLQRVSWGPCVGIIRSYILIYYLKEFSKLSDNLI